MDYCNSVFGELGLTLIPKIVCNGEFETDERTEIDQNSISVNTSFFFKIKQTQLLSVWHVCTVKLFLEIKIKKTFAFSVIMIIDAVALGNAKMIIINDVWSDNIE